MQKTPTSDSASSTRSSNSSTDKLFSDPMDLVPNFVFDARVASVFPDMIKRSVPGYTTILDMSGQIARRFASPGSNIYDLGSSLGATTSALLKYSDPQTKTNVIAVDNSADMLVQAKETLAEQPNAECVKLVHDDICSVGINNASVCVLNFTLQFIDLTKRDSLLKKIHQGLNDDGILIVSEKLAFNDQEHQELMIELHHDFKKNNGYSDLEIAQKREAIENVLIPETFETHKQRLLAAGFKSANLWFQCFNFASIVAFK